MRCFHLQRNLDETGVGGTGRVAEGLEMLVAIHSHGGNTEVVLEDE